MTMLVNGSLTSLYLDGIVQTLPLIHMDYYGYGVPFSIFVRRSVGTIALSASRISESPGISLHISGLYDDQPTVSDGQWKCIDVRNVPPEADWTNPEFDDFSWPWALLVDDRSQWIFICSTHQQAKWKGPGPWILIGRNFAVAGHENTQASLSAKTCFNACSDCSFYITIMLLNFSMGYLKDLFSVLFSSFHTAPSKYQSFAQHHQSFSTSGLLPSLPSFFAADFSFNKFITHLEQTTLTASEWMSFNFLNRAFITFMIQDALGAIATSLVYTEVQIKRT
jgi:hypothetical protein